MVNFCLLIITRQNQKILVLVISLRKQPKFCNPTTLKRPLLLTFHGKFKGMQCDFSTRKTSRERNCLWDRQFPSLSRVHLEKRAEEEGGKNVGSFPYQRLIIKPKLLVVIGKLDKSLPCQQILGPVGRRQHCWPG